MSRRSQPQVLELANKSLPGTLHACDWVPGSARVVVLGSRPRGTGLLQVYEIDGTSIEPQLNMEPQNHIQCGSMEASSLCNRMLATGDSKGTLQTWDLDQAAVCTSSCKAHVDLINKISGCGVEGNGLGCPAIATAGSDSFVKVWDPRDTASPALCFPPHPQAAECWAVAFGNAHTESERCLLAGYSDGSLKLFDLRTGTTRWQINTGSGVVSVGFDRLDIQMNKFAATCLDSSLHVFDARTQHSEQGFACHKEEVPGGSTLWGCAHLPQHRELCMVSSGDGSLRLYKYEYPARRRRTDPETKEAMGVAGSLELLLDHKITEQPVSCFNWHSEKQGLFCCTALDQCMRIGMVTKLHLY